MRNFLLGATLLTGLAALAAPAEARLQLTIDAGASSFSCFDGQLGCDLSGGANNLLLVNTAVGGAFVQLSLAQSTFGPTNELQLSSSNIVNETGGPLTVRFLASDTGYAGPVTAINNSGSLTFNQNVGAPNSTLQFFADVNDTQGANPNNAPGALLESVSGHAVTDPDSFAGSKISAFNTLGLYSMTETADLVLRSGGSVTGFNQSMESINGAIPEPSTWAMLGLGFAGMAFMGFKRSRKGDRLATLA